MARLRDVPHVLRTVGVIGFVRRIWKQGSDDQLMTWAAALAYSWLFAVFPFFIFLMTLVPYLPDRTKATVGVELHNLVNLFPRQAAETLWTNVEQHLLNPPPGSMWLRVTGLVLALWAASGGMAMTMNALDKCYELKESRAFHRHRLLAMTLTVTVASLILMVVLLLPVGGIVKAWIIAQQLRGLHKGSPALVAFDVARWVLAMPFMVSILTVLYHWGPNVRHRFHWVTPGAVFSIVVWVTLGLGFKLYLERFVNYNKTYGTVGGAAVLLLFFYIDAAVLLWGAEINSEIDFEVLKVRRGTRDFLPAEVAAEVQALAPEAGSTAPSPTEPLPIIAPMAPPP
jgi:membrane protein